METSTSSSTFGIMSQIVRDEYKLSDELAGIKPFLDALGSEDFGIGPRIFFHTSKYAEIRQSRRDLMAGS